MNSYDSLPQKLCRCPICGGKADYGYYDAYSCDSSFEWIGCADCNLIIPHGTASDWNKLGTELALPKSHVPPPEIFPDEKLCPVCYRKAKRGFGRDSTYNHLKDRHGWTKEQIETYFETPVQVAT